MDEPASAALARPDWSKP